MAEGMLMFVRFDDPEDVRMETVGRPLSPDDEVRLVDDDDHEVAPGEVVSIRVHQGAFSAKVEPAALDEASVQETVLEDRT